MMRIYVSYHTMLPAPIVERMIEQLRWRYGPLNISQIAYSGLAPYQYSLLVQQNIAISDVVLVLVDQSWLNVSNSNALPALSDPQSPLFLELYAALQSHKLLIPILLNDSRMPTAQELPPLFAPFTFRQACKIRTEPWFRQDMDTLYNQIQSQTSWRPASLLLLSACIVLLIAFIGQIYVLSVGKDNVDLRVTTTVDLVASTTVLLGSFITYFYSVWLSLTRKQYIWLSGISPIFCIGVFLLIYADFVANLLIFPIYLTLLFCFSLFGKRLERVS